jgi:hypothetical protein
MAQDGFSARANADDDCATCPDKTENIIIVGSEFEYTDAGFWLKCMFLACGFAVAQGRTPPPGWSTADRTTLLYVPLGYVRHELLALDWLRDNLGTNIVRCTSKANVLSHLRNRKVGGKTHKIKNLVAFCHGLPGYFSLNYSGPGDAMNIYGSDFERLPSDLFAPNGKVFSYACRTAVSTIFNGVLGQRIADHFGVTVRAYHRRTNYGAVMRQRSSSAALATALVAARKTQEGQKIALPPEHEAFPHPGMGNGVLGIWGASAEGTDDYALWRTAGAVSLPAEGTTPAGEPTGYATLTPA